MRLSDLKPNDENMFKEPRGFKKIPGWEDYFCNKFGEIGTYKWYKSGWRLRKLSIHKEGYLFVVLNNGKKFKCFLVHRIVGKLFVKNRLNKPFINHKNGIKTDNYYKNLEWVTYEENNKHSRDILGHTIVGSKNPSARITMNDVNNILKLKDKMSQNKIAKELNITQHTISRIINNKHYLVRL